jgi:hypothetical protein
MCAAQLANRAVETERAEVERLKAHNRLQQGTLHELHARMKDKDARAEQLEAALNAADTVLGMTYDLDKANPWKHAEQKAAWERYRVARVALEKGRT